MSVNFCAGISKFGHVQYALVGGDRSKTVFCDIPLFEQQTWNFLSFLAVGPNIPTFWLSNTHVAQTCQKLGMEEEAELHTVPPHTHLVVDAGMRIIMSYESA